MISDIPRFEKTIGKFLRDYLDKYGKKGLYVLEDAYVYPSYQTLLIIAKKFNIPVINEKNKNYLLCSLLTRECYELRFYTKFCSDLGDQFPFISVDAIECIQYNDRARPDPYYSAEYSPDDIAGFDFSYEELAWLHSEFHKTDILKRQDDPSKHSRWLGLIASQRDLIARMHAYQKGHSFHRVPPFIYGAENTLIIPRTVGILQ